MPPKTVLIADDEPRIVEILERYLSDDGFNVSKAYDGQAAADLGRSLRPDLVLLDLKLPLLSGFDVFRELRRHSSVPVIMLTSRTDEVDRVLGLELGADDYITKPFSPREVVARVKAVLRRSAPPDVKEHRTDHIAIGDLWIKPSEHEVRLRDGVVTLTPTEFRILVELARNVGRTFTRSQLLDNVRGDDLEVYDRTLDRHIGNLRHKIEPDPANPRYIITVFGVGYKMVKN